MTFMPSRENVDLLRAAILQQACEDYMALYSGRKAYVVSGAEGRTLYETTADMEDWFHSTDFHAFADGIDPDILLNQLHMNVKNHKFRILNPDRFKGTEETMSRKKSKAFNEKKGVYKPTAEVKS